MAETTTAIGPFFRSVAMIWSTRASRSAWPTDDPPNFITRYAPACMHPPERAHRSIRRGASREGAAPFLLHGRGHRKGCARLALGPAFLSLKRSAHGDAPAAPRPDPARPRRSRGRRLHGGEGARGC